MRSYIMNFHCLVFKQPKAKRRLFWLLFFFCQTVLADGSFNMTSWQEAEVSLAVYQQDTVALDLVTKQDLWLSKSPDHQTSTELSRLGSGSILETTLDKATFFKRLQGLGYHTLDPKSLIIKNSDLPTILGSQRRSYRVLLEGSNTSGVRRGDTFDGTPQDLSPSIQTNVNAEIALPDPDDEDTAAPTPLKPDVMLPSPNEDEAASSEACSSCIEKQSQSSLKGLKSQAQQLTDLSNAKNMALLYSRDSKTRKMVRVLYNSRASKPTGFCYRKVKQGLLLGGLVNKKYEGISGTKAGPQLQRDGFKNLLSESRYKNLLMKDPKKAPNGAIMVYAGGPYGHIEVRVDQDGRNGFVSDFFNHRARTGDSGVGRGRRLIGVYVRDDIEMARRATEKSQSIKVSQRDSK